MLNIFMAAVLLQATGTRELTLQNAIELFMSQSDFASILDSQATISNALVSEAKTWTNPEINVSHEKVDGDPASASESYVVLSQEFVISGERKYKVRAAEHMREAQRFTSLGQKNERIFRIKYSFFEILALQKQLDIYRSWLEKLEENHKVISAQTNEGQLSGIDLSTSLLELEKVKREFKDVQLQLRTNWLEFREFAGISYTEIPKFIGTVSPPQNDGLTVQKNPGLQALESIQNANQMSAMAASRSKIPAPKIGVGMKKVDNDLVSENGVFISATLSLPIFDTGKTKAAISNAKAAIAKAQRGLLENRLKGQAEGFAKVLQDCNEMTHQLKSSVSVEAEKLVSTSLVAYQAGELDLYRLLNAFEWFYEIQNEVIKYELKARQAELNWGKIMGVSHD